MSLPLLEDAPAEEAGGKAAALGLLSRAGLPVPTGVVVPASWSLREVHEAELRRAVGAALTHLPGAARTHLAVRSSATTEDGAVDSAAGQHDTVLAVQGLEAACAAIRRCWASADSDRAVAYRRERSVAEGEGMAVLLQAFIDADSSGVLFTGEPRVLEAVHGLGDLLVGGQVTPDSWRFDEPGIPMLRPGAQTVRSVRRGDRVVHGPVPSALRGRPALTTAQVREVVALGERIRGVLGGDVDVEWAFTGARPHVLQARPLTASLPGTPGDGAGIAAETLAGTAASSGTATGPVRHVRGPGDFARIRPGDVMVAAVTDPAWTPLFPLLAAVVTETGGVLSHAAIIAREMEIPAVLAVPGALDRLTEGDVVRVDGTRGVISRVTMPEG